MPHEAAPCGSRDTRECWPAKLVKCKLPVGHRQSKTRIVNKQNCNRKRHLPSYTLNREEHNVYVKTKTKDEIIIEHAYVEKLGLDLNHLFQPVQLKHIKSKKLSTQQKAEMSREKAKGVCKLRSLSCQSKLPKRATQRAFGSPIQLAGRNYLRRSHCDDGKQCTGERGGGDPNRTPRPATETTELSKQAKAARGAAGDAVDHTTICLKKYRARQSLLKQKAKPSQDLNYKCSTDQLATQSPATSQSAVAPPTHSCSKIALQMTPRFIPTRSYEKDPSPRDIATICKIFDSINLLDANRKLSEQHVAPYTPDSELSRNASVSDSFTSPNSASENNAACIYSKELLDQIPDDICNLQDVDPPSPAESVTEAAISQTTAVTEEAPKIPNVIPRVAHSRWHTMPAPDRLHEYATRICQTTQLSPKRSMPVDIVTLPKENPIKAQHLPLPEIGTCSITYAQLEPYPTQTDYQRTLHSVLYNRKSFNRPTNSLKKLISSINSLRCKLSAADMCKSEKFHMGFNASLCSQQANTRRIAQDNLIKFGIIFLTGFFMPLVFSLLLYFGEQVPEPTTIEKLLSLFGIIYKFIVRA